VKGEIYIGGTNVGRGYLLQATLTAERFVPNRFSLAAGERLYRTGDQGKWTAEGQIEFLGRRDDQVKIRGYRIECSEIQSVLAKHPEIAETVIQSWEDGSERRLVAYVTCYGARKPEISALRDYLREYFPEYMIPAVFIFLDSFPLTPHGKLDRRALPPPVSHRREIGAQYVAPLTDSQSRLAGIMSELLGIENVGIHDNFFELGGHSLLATRVIARVRSEFAVEVPLRVLFEDPTVARLEKRIEQRGKGETAKQLMLIRLDSTGSKPLSYAQQRLWFLQQLDPGSVAYNMPFRLRIQGPLYKDALQASFNELARRHEILHTQFVQQDENPVQVVVPDALPLIEHADLRDCQDRELQATLLAMKEAQTPFDLQRAPLLRLKLVQLAEDEHVLITNMHHIISDGWSVGIILREAAVLYNAYVNGRPAHLNEMPIQYADYAVAQRKWLQGEIFEEQRAYWRQELAGAPVLELPVEYTRVGIPSYAGTTLEWEFSEEFSGRLRQFCHREGVTLFMVLMAGLQMVLSRYSGQDDISVATPVAGRRWSETENLIGFFVNTLVLRARIKGRMGLRELLRQIRETALRAYAHQDLPFEKLVEDLQPERDLGGMPLFKVMFVLQNTPRTWLQVPGLKIFRERLSTGNQKFAMTIGAVDGQRRIDGALSYRDELFSGEMMNRLLEHWKCVLHSMVATPEFGLDDLTMLTTAEREQILEEWNRTQTEFPLLTIHALFEQQVGRTPHAVAVEYEEKWLSYDELNRRANQAARYLKKLGAGPETVIGICMERSLEMVVALLGILKAGAAYMPLDPDYPADRLVYMAEHSRSPVILVQQAFRERWAALVRTVAFDHEWDEIGRESEANLEAPVDINNPAYVIYTSGSTGRPKGVMVTHAALSNHMQWMGVTFAIDERDRVLQKTAFSFDASVWEFYAPLLFGGCLVLARPGGQRDRDYLLHCLADMRITIVQLVPSQLQMLVEVEGLEHCPCLRRAYCGGEALSMALVKRLHERAPWVKLCNLYGPTEATIDSVFEECSVEEDKTAALIGNPVANMRAYVVSESMNLAPACVWGELFLGGAGLARGYDRQPELTAERFLPDPFSRTAGERLYRTGDIVRWGRRGKLEFAGRRDHQVKLRGFRIELKEIETVLAQQEAIAESAVIIRGEPGEERLLAYVILNKKSGPPEFKESVARQYLQKKLPHYMQPAAIIVLEEWPLLPNGKLDRGNLPEPESGGAVTDDAPQTPEAELLCGIWREVLKIKAVGIHDDFFRLGGHSLLATQVVSRIRSVFQLELPLRALFEAATVAEQAAWIAGERRKQPGWSIPPLTRMERGIASPLSYAQQRLWFLDQLEPGSVAYNMPLRIRLKGNLNTRALQASFDALARRHEVLRTRFVMEEEGPVQVVAAELPARIEGVDLRALAREEKEIEASRIAQREAVRPFDLSQGPLIRVKLLQLEEEEHVLLLNLHHIICDGWSLGIMIEEIASFYQGYVSGEEAKLRELPIQYADYARWQREWLQGAILDEQIGYWRRNLEGAAALNLPRERRLEPGTAAGASKKWAFSAELSQQLRDLSYRQGVTLFMTLLAGFQALLSRYSGQNDISVGTPIAGRIQTEMEGLIGFFANTLVLRVNSGKACHFGMFSAAYVKLLWQLTRIRMSHSRKWSRNYSRSAIW
jgi:amino acid adenylation domain-containing protein